MSLGALSRVMPPPASPIDAKGDWRAVEAAIGTPLPDDYKEFVETYGSGAIGSFLTVFNAFSRRPALGLIEQSQTQRDVLRSLQDDFGEEIPYALHPTPGGLLPVALTDNGDVVHWLTAGAPNDWTIVVNESRSPDYEGFACDLTTFLQGLVERTLTCRAFHPSTFASDNQFATI